MSNVFLQKPGLIVALLGMIGMVIVLSIQGLILFEKIITFIVCVIIFLGGLISETSFVDRFKKQGEELWN